MKGDIYLRNCVKCLYILIVCVYIYNQKETKKIKSLKGFFFKEMTFPYSLVRWKSLLAVHKRKIVIAKK